MKKYYFTYSLEGQIFQGGWSVVLAPDSATAHGLFHAAHPENSTHYAGFYEETLPSSFEAGNFGAYAHEIISVHSALLPNAEKGGNEF